MRETLTLGLARYEGWGPMEADTKNQVTEEQLLRIGARTGILDLKKQVKKEKEKLKLGRYSSWAK